MASIVELADLITKSVGQLNDYASAHNITTPSLDIDSPVSWNIPPEAKEIAAARKTALSAIKQLEAALQGPKEYFQNLVQIGSRNVPIQAITRFQIAKAFPVGQEVAIAHLASRDNIKIPQSDLERLLRYAVGMGIFGYGQQPNYIRHTAISRMLAESEDVHDWTAVACDTMWASIAQTVNAMVKYPGSQEAYETGFNLAEQTDLTFYQFFERNPRRVKEFTGTMDNFAKVIPEYSTKHLLDGFAWGELSQGVVVDLGGSTGHFVFALAEAFPELRCIVQDLPGVIQVAVVPPKLARNVSFMAHDFFQPQPVQHADVYMLRWILHNWPDQYAIRILQSLIPALKVGSRVLIVDEVMPLYGTVSQELELIHCHMDILMFAIQNARLRSAEEWKNLLIRADPRFVLKGIKTPPGSLLSFFEVEWSASPNPNKGEVKVKSLL